MVERKLVLVETLFKCSFLESNVEFAVFVVVCDHMCLADDACCKKIAAYWAVLFYTAVASFLGVGGGGVGVDYILVVVCNKCFHVTHSALTDLDGVLVKYAVQCVLFWEVFVNKLEEDSTDVRLYAYTVWGFIPYYVALLFPFITVCLFDVGEAGSVATGF